MSWTAIIISYASMSFLLLFASSIIKNQELGLVKAYLFLWGVMNVFLLGLFPMAISLNSSTPSALNPVSIALFSVNILLLLLFTWLYMVFLIRNFSVMVQQLTKGKGGE